MTKSIQKVAIIGAGVMGAQIAAHCANGGADVLLYDIVKDEADKNSLAKAAIASFKKADPAPLTHKSLLKKITPCNLDTDLDKLKDVDLVIEAIIERLDIKQSLYANLEPYLREDCILTSNTSTLPLNQLVEELPANRKAHFAIMHFFNPPRYMRLLELVGGADTKPHVLETIEHFADVHLGKGVVHAKDTAGFIANRIGTYFMMRAVNEAVDTGISVEEADAVLSRPIGIPKTGVFGLLDLIGIDLLPLIAKSYAENLPESDGFNQIFKDHAFINEMIESGYNGRKGKGGFYRLKPDDKSKTKQVRTIATGDYGDAIRPRVKAAYKAKKGWRNMIEHDSPAGHYAKNVLLDTLHYTLGLHGEIADDINNIDEAMKLGYNWKYGPFELVDRLGNDKQSGTEYLQKAFEEKGLSIPPILAAANGKPFYSEADGHKHIVTLNGNKTLHYSADSYMLADKKRGRKPLAKNPSASLWDIGDGVVCLEYHSKMNTVDPLIFDMMDKAVETITSNDDFKGLVIYNDADNFCAGANIGLALFSANVAAFKMLEDFVKRGQDTYMKLKYAPFPVVAAPSGLALGGGCEILLHSDAVQAHIETYTGLVEVGVGIIPGWGGCKEMVVRSFNKHAKKTAVASAFGSMFSPLKGVGDVLSKPFGLGVMKPLIEIFTNIGTAKIAKSAAEARDIYILNDASRITMNRKRLLPDAKKRCLELVENYQAPEPAIVRLPGKTARTAFAMGIKDMDKKGLVTPHDHVVSAALANVLSGGETNMTEELTEQDILDLERQEFAKLLRNTATLNRIEHMLETGKPLRN